MLMSNKKDKASLIVAAMRPAAAPEQEAAPEAEMDGEKAAAEELMHALAAKDAEAVKEALKSLIHMCMDEYESEEAPEAEGSESAE